jgi:hypothetical protein
LLAGYIGVGLRTERRHSVLKLPQDIDFKGPLGGAPQSAVLYGDPTKPGVFVTRVKFPAGTKDLPHWHPDEVRTVAVLSGTLYFGVGEKWDESKFKAYPTGTFYAALLMGKGR